jgi:hypothetical protein
MGVHDGGSRRVQGSDWWLSRLGRAGGGKGGQGWAIMGYFYSASSLVLLDDACFDPSTLHVRQNIRFCRSHMTEESLRVRS